MEIKKESLTFSIDKNINAKELYKFIKENMNFDEVVELYKLLHYKMEYLEDDSFIDYDEKMGKVKNDN